MRVSLLSACAALRFWALPSAVVQTRPVDGLREVSVPASYATPDKFGLLFRVVSVFVKPGPFDTFEPDIYVEDEQSLSGYGLDAKIVYLPGHTKGSIGILTSDGDLFCGDLMDSMMGRPSLEFFIDDMAAAKASLQRLRRLKVGTVYPGHGKPFLFERVRRSR